MTRGTILIQAGIGLAIFVAAALAQGYDLSWDTLDYHFYNGFAAVHGKVWSNIQVAMLQTYYSPLLDIPFYVLVVILPPMLVAVVLAAVQSLLYLLLFLLACEVFAPVFVSQRRLFAIASLLAIVGVAAPVNVLEVGSAYGDNTTAVAVITALLLTLRGMKSSSPSVRIWHSAAAGALAGFAAGMKLTNVPFALAIGVVLASRILLDRSPDDTRVAVRSTMAGGFAMAGAFLLLYGWWAAALLAHFGNPFFPSFNQIFRSEYAATSSFSMERLAPAFALPTLRDKLLFPFTRISILGPLNWAGLFDLRMAFALPLAVTGLIATVFRFRLANVNSGPEPAIKVSLFVFFLTAYWAWLLVFPVNRYIVTLELVTPIICAACVASLVPRISVIWATCVVLAVVLPASAIVSFPLMWRPADRRFDDGNGYFGVSFNVPTEVERGGALVLLLSDKPTTFVIPFFPRSTDFARLQGSLFYESPGFNALQFGSDAQLRRRVFGNAMGRAICRRLSAQQGPLYALRPSDNENALDTAAVTYYGVALDAGGCRPVMSKAAFPMELCPATRLPRPECAEGLGGSK